MTRTTRTVKELLVTFLCCSLHFDKLIGLDSASWFIFFQKCELVRPLLAFCNDICTFIVSLLIKFWFA